MASPVGHDRKSQTTTPALLLDFSKPPERVSGNFATPKQLDYFMGKRLVCD